MPAVIIAIISLLNFIQPNVSVNNAWLRPAGQGMNSAMYFSIENKTDAPDTLYKAASSTAELVQIHETFKKDGLMGMRQVKYVVIPAGSTLSFKPGGYHVMFIKLKRDFKVNSKINVYLFFKHAGKIRVKALVKLQ